MIKLIKEAFSEDLPDWLRQTLQRVSKNHWDGKRNIEGSHIAWDKAKYIEAPIPKSARDANIKNDSLLCVYRLKFPDYVWSSEEHKKVLKRYEYFTYIPGIEVPDLYRYSDLLGISSYGQRTYINKMAFSRWQPYIVNFGYIDLNEAGTYELRKSRRDSREGSIERDREKGQHSYREYIGNGEYSKEIKWITARGYDKSGYKLDPDKYLKKLASLESQDSARAQRKIKALYDKIEQTKAKAAEILTNKSIEDLNKYPDDNKYDPKIETFNSAVQYIARAAYYYRDLLEDLDRHSKNASDKEWIKEWNAQSLAQNSKEINEYLEEANKKLDRIL